MKLKKCLEIGFECGIETIKESIRNIEIHQSSLFGFSEIEKELNELYTSYCELVLNERAPFTKESKIEDAIKYLEGTERGD